MLAGQADKTLIAHVAALRARALAPLEELEKKMLRAEKRRFEAQQRQLHQLCKALFPEDGLQERVENFMPYYARWGRDFLKAVYEHSLTLEQQFGVIMIEG